MSAKNESIVRSMVDAIRNADKAKTSPYDTQATVRRVESGVAWVHIPGGVDETPVKLTIAAKPGDTVQVRVSGGRAFLVGNASAPPTDDRTAISARDIARKAAKQADENADAIEKTDAAAKKAQEAAAAAQIAADEAADIAEATEQHFWNDAAGVHVSSDEGDAEGENNILMNSLGVLLRKAGKILAQFSASQVAFYDGLGNAASNIIASFGTSGATIGKASGRNIKVNDTDGVVVTKPTNGSTASALTIKDGTYEGTVGLSTLHGLARVDIYPGINTNDLHAYGDVYAVDAYGNEEASLRDVADAISNIGTTRSASASKTIDTAGIDTYTEGPSVTLTAGVWVVNGQWVFNTGSSASARNLGIQLSPNSGSTAYGAYKMVRVFAANNSFASLEITDIITLTATTRVYLKGASSMTYTTAAGTAIKAIRIK